MKTMYFQTMYSLMAMLTVVTISAAVAGVACGAEKADRMLPVASAKTETQKAKAVTTKKAVMTKKDEKARKAGEKSAGKPVTKEQDGKRKNIGKKVGAGTMVEGRRKNA